MKNKIFLCIPNSKVDKFNQNIFSVEHSLINFFLKIKINLHIANPFITYKDINIYDGLLISGGNSIAKNTKGYCNIRFNFENKIIKKFIKNNKPIIGICYGFQRINKFLGGKVQVDHQNKKLQFNKHSISINFGKIKKKSFTNHYHNDHIGIDDLSNNLKVIALDQTNYTVEAAYSIKKKVLGIQWHPERKFSNKVIDLNLINQFLSLI